METIKLSIIIPNYNNGKYLEECFDSIYSQDLMEFEIIVIDDGSTDDSKSIIENYMKKKDNMTLICQPNMNASVARNKGIELAKGEYIFFLDSDDIILPDSLNIMMENMKNDMDLVVGNFITIDDEQKEIGKNKNGKIGVLSSLDVMEIANISPVPSNKLFRKSIIEKYQVYFANVNIGQDLNFFLKYLCCCNKIMMLEDDIYGHRLVENGMTFSTNFKIFDITKVFNDVNKFYKKMKKEVLVQKYIESVAFKHYFWQMNKQIKFPKWKERKLIIDYFTYHINKLNLKKCKNKDFIKRDVRIYTINKYTKLFTSSKCYGWLFKKMLSAKNIKF